MHVEYFFQSSGRKHSPPSPHLSSYVARVPRKRIFVLVPWSPTGAVHVRVGDLHPLPKPAAAGGAHPDAAALSSEGFGLLRDGKLFFSSSPADPSWKPCLCSLPILSSHLVSVSSLRSPSLTHSSDISERAPDSCAQRLAKMPTDNAGWRLRFYFFFFFAVTVSLMCVVFPCSPFQRREHVRAAPVKWPVQLLLRENFPSGPLPNASDHCFCPRLPAWGWSAGVPSSSETPQQEGAGGAQGGLPPASRPAPRAPQDGHMASTFLQAVSSSFPLSRVVFNPPVSKSWPLPGSEVRIAGEGTGWLLTQSLAWQEWGGVMAPQEDQLSLKMRGQAWFSPFYNRSERAFPRC